MTLIIMGNIANWCRNPHIYAFAMKDLLTMSLFGYTWSSKEEENYPRFSHDGLLVLMKG